MSRFGGIPVKTSRFGGVPVTEEEELGLYQAPSSLATSTPKEGYAADLAALIEIESRGRDYDDAGNPLTSSMGAKYKAQVMPATAGDPGYGVTPAQADTPEEYNRVGEEYYVALLRRYEGDVAKAAAAYNTGPGNVNRAIEQHGDNWLQALSEETRNYVPKFLALREKGLQEKPQPAGMVAAAQQTDTPYSLEPWEPSFLDRIRGALTPGKDASAVELAAREVASERGVAPGDVYEAAGGGAPAFTLEGSTSGLSTALVESGKIGVKGLQLADVDAWPATTAELPPWIPREVAANSGRTPADFWSDVGIKSDAQLKQTRDALAAATIGDIKTSQKAVEDATPKGIGMGDQGVRSAVQSVAMNAPGLLVSALTRSPAPALASMYAMVEADSYASARSEGKTPEQAKLYSRVDGAIEVATELIPTNKLLSIFGAKGKADLRKRVLSYLGSEQVTEQVATLGQSLNAYANDLDEELAGAKSPTEVIEIQARRQALTAVSTLIASSVQGAGAASPYFARVLADSARRAAQSPEARLGEEMSRTVDAGQFTTSPEDAAAKIFSAGTAATGAQVLDTAPTQQPAAGYDQRLSPTAPAPTDFTGMIAGQMQPEAPGVLAEGSRATWRSDDGVPYPVTVLQPLVELDEPGPPQARVEYNGVEMLVPVSQLAGQTGEQQQRPGAVSFTPADSPTAQAGLQPIIVPEVRRVSQPTTPWTGAAERGGQQGPYFGGSLGTGGSVPGGPVSIRDLTGSTGLAGQTGPVAGASVQPAPSVDGVRGAPIDQEWTSFTPESGTLNIPRDRMPQVKAEHRGALANFLKARGVTGEEKVVPAASLQPTQTEFSEAKVTQAKNRDLVGGTQRAILVSTDGHILDGHHQWLAKRDAGEDVRVIELDAPTEQLLSLVEEFPSSSFATEGVMKDDQAPQSPASGVPSGLPSAATPVSEKAARNFNNFLKRTGQQGTVRLEEVPRQNLPDALGGALAAIEEVTGTQVAVIRNLTPEVMDWNGVTFRDDVLLVDETAQAPVTTVALHEFTHNLKKTDPDLYRLLEDEVRRQGKLEDWRKELSSRAGQEIGIDEALEELTSDATGDAMGDKGFLTRMAQQNPTKFAQLANKLIDFLDQIIGKIRGLGSEQYLTDVTAFRDVLAKVLEQYTPASARQAAAAGAPVQSRRGPADTTGLIKVASLEQTRAVAAERRFPNQRELKQAIQSLVKEEARAAGVDLTARTPATTEYLVSVAKEDVIYALRDNPNAVGWYSDNVDRAMSVLEQIHPELNDDLNARFAFTYALAATSNGLRVGKNMELAEAAYRGYKETGAFPAVGAGNAAEKINETLELFSVIEQDMGIDTFRENMMREAEVREIEALFGIRVTGENKGTVVRGAAIIGPKIGNGFFANLNGAYEQLTMDRWLMRTWGRWTGTLIEENRVKIKEGRDRVRDALRDLRRQPGEADRIRKIVGKSLTVGDPDTTAKAVQSASTKKDIREQISATPQGDELRRAAISLAKNLDGQKEAPKNGGERNFIRKIAGETLAGVKDAHPDLTMADLQAALWYSEKRLYDLAKSKEDIDAGYADDAAPDYYNAAKALAKKLGVEITDETGNRARPARRRDIGVPGETPALSRKGERVPFRPDREDLERRLREDGGVTYNADGTVYEADTGYSVALLSEYPGENENIFWAARAFAGKHRELLRYPQAKVGLYVMEDGRTALDLSMITESRDEAVALGTENNQESVWDYAAGGTISTGGTGAGVFTRQEAEETLAGADGTDQRRELSDAKRQRFETARRENRTGLEGAIEPDGRARLGHWSLSPNVERTDPTQFGRGLSGRSQGEAGRLKTALPRTYFGIDAEVNPYIPESGLGPYYGEYLIEGAKLYPLNEDPDGLYRRDGDDDMERDIYEAGYDGYWVENQQIGKVAAVFVPLDLAKPKLSRRTEDGDRGRRNPGREIAPLEGAPIIKGATGPDPALVEVAEKYAQEKGIDLRRQAEYVEVDEARARRIAEAYEAMSHAPDDPRVQAAYQDLIEQTVDQYRALVDAGYQFWFTDLDIPSNAEYLSTPWNAMRDLRANKEMGVFPTAEGFGSSDLDVADNPLLAETGFEWPVGGLDGPLKPVLANDLFRAVHDAFGHGLEGAGFRAQGEENAWQAHVRLFTGDAVGAITTETRGQNSWLNYGPYGESNRTAKVEDTVFADQKTGLMPEWTWMEGRVDDAPALSRRSVKLSDTLATAAIKVGGIDSSYRQDILGDTRGNKVLPGVGALFSPRGHSPDQMAVRLMEEGYLTEAQVGDMDARDFIYEAIRRELGGGTPRYQLEFDPMGDAISPEQEYQRYLDEVDPIPFSRRINEDNGPASPVWQQAAAKGLDMSQEARMQRARAMGFDTDTVVYHGSAKGGFVDTVDITEFDLDRVGDRYGQDRVGFFFTSETDEASGYATTDGIGMPSENGAVYPVHLKMVNPLQVDDQWALDTWGRLGPSNEGSIAFWDNNHPEILKAAEQGNHDAVIIDDGDYQTYVVFNPNQIRSVNAAFDPDHSDSPDIRFSRRFYSELGRKVNDGPASAKRDQWRGYIKGLTKKGVKPDEIEWSGVLEWLDLQEGKISREAVSDYLATNGVRVEEVTLGQPSEDEIQLLLDDEMGGEMTREDAIEYLQNEEGAPKYAQYTVPGGENYREVLLTLPGKKNAPVDSGKSAATMSFERDMMEKYGGETFPSVYGKLNGDEIDKYEMLVREDRNSRKSESIKQDRRNNYKSSHWDQPNVLAHVRMDDRVMEETVFSESSYAVEQGADMYTWWVVDKGTRRSVGSPHNSREEAEAWVQDNAQRDEVSPERRATKTLFVQEIQSDWAQEGRKKGFASKAVSAEKAGPVKTIPGNGLRDRYEQPWRVTMQDGSVEERMLPVGVDPMMGAADKGGPPRAPFVQNTDAWVTLALKRIIAHAAEGGYDKVAFINGEQAADLFDLSKQVSEVDVNLRPNGNYDVIAYPLSGPLVNALGDSGHNVPVEALPDLIGKELADRAIEEITEKQSAGGLAAVQYRGLDLKVGGEGMRGFYDNIVPKVARNLLKKLGGGQLERVNVSGAEGYGITVTDDMRKQVLDEGVPLFSRRSVMGNQIQSSWSAPEPTKMEGFIYRIQDKQIDTKRVVKAINEQVGQIEDQWDPYLQEGLFHGRAAEGVARFLDNELKPLYQELQTRGETIESLEEFLHHDHAKERNAQIRKVNPNFQGPGSGIEDAAADAYFASLSQERMARLSALRRRVREIVWATQDLLVSSGLETQDTIDTWRQTYPNYIPLEREDLDFGLDLGGQGTGQGYSVRGSSSRRATGSTRPVKNIMANIALQRERAIVRAEKNRVALALYGLAVQNPNTDFWLPLNPDATLTARGRQALTDELVSMGLNPLDADGIVERPKEAYVDPTTGLVQQRVNPMLTRSPNVVSVRINGKDRHVLFNQNNERAARMVQSLKNLDANQLGEVLERVAPITRYFASINTQYNPVFGVTNFTRDIQFAALSITSTEIAGKEAEVLSHVAPALAGIYKDLRSRRKGRGPTQTNWAQLWEDFKDQGGQTGYREMFRTSDDRRKALEREAKRLSSGVVSKGAHAVFDWLSDYNAAMENAVRLSAYKVALDAGVSKQRAAMLAKNLTVNFNRKGAWGQQAGAMYAFFNAAVQGTETTIRTLRGPAGKKIVAGGLALGAAQAMLLAAAGFGEDEPPEFVKQRNLIIPLFNESKGYITIPMPLGFHVIPNVSRVLTESWLKDWDDTTGSIVDLLGVFADSFNPIGHAGLSMQTVLPTVADPLAALAENRDWGGRPIYREKFSDRDVSPGVDRGRDTASVLSKQLAKYLNYATGGTDYVAGAFSPSPDQIDYLIGQVTGGVGREALKTAQLVETSITGEELPPYKVPLGGRFYGKATGSNAAAGPYYESLRRMAEHRAELKGRAEDGLPVGDYFVRNPDARLAQEAVTSEGIVRNLRKALRAAVEQGAPKERVRSLEDKIQKEMIRFNTKVDQGKDYLERRKAMNLRQ